MVELLPQKPDAVFAISDTMALGALRVLREHQIRVPQDMGIMGFDDLPPAVQADPQLTTIRQPTDEQGALAVETILELIDNPQRPLRQMALPIELIVRASTK
ncbi:substrate-binding domain-containing protein, partial [Arthrospira platensis SPKY1]|nr:substrate-binding domain-containing protein [Arthrospira platensis SPKY1]